MCFQAYGRSDIGRARKNNQDSGYFSSKACVVADGVGGAAAGEVASATMVHTLARCFESNIPQALRSAFAKANDKLSARIAEQPETYGMATTCTGIFLGQAGLSLAHLGDSRCYRLHDHKFSQVTRDDTWAQLLVDQGLLEPEEVATYPMRNLLLHALSGGIQDSAVVSISTFDVVEGDRWVLTSDGVHSYLDADLIEQIVSTAADARTCADELVERALEKTHDNVTAIVADVVIDHFEDTDNFVGAAIGESLTLPSWQLPA